MAVRAVFTGVGCSIASCLVVAAVVAKRRKSRRLPEVVRCICTPLPSHHTTRSHLATLPSIRTPHCSECTVPAFFSVFLFSFALNVPCNSTASLVLTLHLTPFALTPHCTLHSTCSHRPLHIHRVGQNCIYVYMHCI